MLRNLQPCLWILIISPILGLASQENTTCGSIGNADNICSPKTDEVWKENEGPYLAVWNHEYPTYAASDTLSIYIYFVEQFEKKPIAEFHNLANDGQYPIRVNRTWFDPSLVNSTSGSHHALFYLIETGVNPLKEMNNLKSVWPPPISFLVAESAGNHNSINPANNPTSIDTSFTIWLIPVIVLGSIILFVLLCFAAYFAYRVHRQRQSTYPDEKGPLDDHLSCNTIYPTIPVMPLKHGQPTYSSSLQDIPAAYIPANLQSVSNISCRSDPPLTSNDALLIADTFRQRMRRPEWPHCHDIVQPLADPPLVTDQEEEQQRRLASELLLKKELEAEGTLMKQVGKRPHLLSTIPFDRPSSA
ncbi:hypothetical protein DM01DRAFT_1403180 [Hesseltinella vesiculosa]|uniref:Uncharacterized protein n=1 Tax=Hesseltinella vesiculosa TaxID=101127 RepID=A0A1X2GXB2_9FUNG|nr:hypothetical protein DM01DRAFT_1403180 [Hesseltinella vesiculosa]